MYRIINGKNVLKFSVWRVHHIDLIPLFHLIALKHNLFFNFPFRHAFPLIETIGYDSIEPYRSSFSLLSQLLSRHFQHETRLLELEVVWLTFRSIIYLESGSKLA